jgi:hypothetical protein
MAPDDVLIERVMAGSGIAGRKRRHEVRLELRSHLEDLIAEARQAGHTDATIATLVAARFGDPGQVASAFARVYRSDRIAFGLAAFGSLAVVALAISYAFVYGVQALLAYGLGVMPARSPSTAHLVSEAVLVGTLTLSYLGLYFAERLFTRFQFAGALGLMALVAGVVVLGTTVTGFGHGLFVSLAFAAAAVARGFERLGARSLVRFMGVAAIVLVAGGLGHLGMRTVPAPDRLTAGLMMILPVCLTIAVSCQLTASLAAIFDRRFLRRHVA